MKHCYDKEAISAHKTRIYILLHKAPNLNGADSQLCSLSLAQSLIFKQNRTGLNRNESLFSFEKRTLLIMFRLMTKDKLVLTWARGVKVAKGQTYQSCQVQRFSGTCLTGSEKRFP